MKIKGTRYDNSCFSYDFMKFNSLDRKMIDEASKMIGEEIPNLMKLMPAEDKDKESDGKTMITGGIFDDVSYSSSSYFQLKNPLYEIDPHNNEEK